MSAGQDVTKPVVDRPSDKRPIFTSEDLSQSHDLMLVEDSEPNRTTLCCKPHAINHMLLTKAAVEITLDRKLFQPYSDCITALYLRNCKLQFKEDFFHGMGNLQFLGLHSCKRLTADAPIKLPDRIRDCRQLEVVGIFKSDVENVPVDLLKCSAMHTIECVGLPVKSLDLVWPSSSHLTELSLSSLGIQEVPKALGGLFQLETFNLDYNPISSLPAELDRLTKLKYLSVKGWNL